MRLHPGADILPDTDNGVSLDFVAARLHIPISSDTKVHFFVGGDSIPMNTGELWYIDANKEHLATNQRTAYRIHLVVDCISNAWLRDTTFPLVR
ncbi:MAG: hypothetical protein ACI9Y1_001485 [Lentisphaeria bacterium]|jgi:hypothetical protein